MGRFLTDFGWFWAGLGKLSIGFGSILADFGPESEISVPRGGPGEAPGGPPDPTKTLRNLKKP